MYNDMLGAMLVIGLPMAIGVMAILYMMVKGDAQLKSKRTSKPTRYDFTASPVFLNVKYKCTRCGYVFMYPNRYDATALYYLFIKCDNCSISKSDKVTFERL